MALPEFTPANQPTLANFSDDKTVQVRRAQFEGGYSQRSRVGPNATSRTVPLQWEVPDPDKAYIDGFFTARSGAEAFIYQLPWDDAAQVWTVETWTMTPIGILGPETVWRISTSLRREFDIV
jgi:phage-related protein